MELKLDAVLIGRILAGVVILVALLSAIVGAAGARSGGFTVFLYALATPLGLGFLIIMVTEIVRVLERDRQPTSGTDEPADGA